MTRTAGANTILAAANTCNAVAASTDGFFAAGAPVTAGQSGVRYFATSQTGEIKQGLAALTTANFAAALTLQ